MTWLMPVLAAVAVAVAGIKWLRVAQREHYLAGSVIGMRRVWIASRVWNVGELMLVAVAAAVWIVRPDSYWPLIGAVAVIVFPLGLALRGRTSPPGMDHPPQAHGGHGGGGPRREYGAGYVVDRPGNR